MNVISLLFLYNLIATDGLQVPGSFGPFFEEITADGTNAVINAYTDFIKQCGHKTSGQVHFDMKLLQDALEDYCAPVVSHWTKNVKFNKVYVKDPNTKKVVLLKKTKIDKSDAAQNLHGNVQQQGSQKSAIDIFIDDNMTQNYYYTRKGVSKP